MVWQCKDGACILPHAHLNVTKRVGNEHHDVKC